LTINSDQFVDMKIQTLTLSSDNSVLYLDPPKMLFGTKWWREKDVYQECLFSKYTPNSEEQLHCHNHQYAKSFQRAVMIELRLFKCSIIKIKKTLRAPHCACLLFNQQTNA